VVRRARICVEKRLWAESLARLNWAEQASSFPGPGWTRPGEAGGTVREWVVGPNSQAQPISSMNSDILFFFSV
jgi:hypothetical protein